MKKTIFILIMILVAVYVALALLGSGGEYAAEVLFYRAMKLNNKIVANPDVAPPKLLAEIEGHLRKIRQGYPKTVTAKQASVILAEFYIANKKYDRALSTLSDIMDKYSGEAALLSTAYFLKGVTYEKQGRWDMALKEFATVRDRYANTQLGIQAPLYIGKHYEGQGDAAKADEAYAQAAGFYEKLERDNSGSMLGYMASTLLIQAYMNAKKYERAGEALENTISKYPSRMSFMQLFPYADFIFVEKLKKPEKAIEIYKEMQGKSKNDKFTKFLEEKIKKLESKK